MFDAEVSVVDKINKIPRLSKEEERELLVDLFSKNEIKSKIAKNRLWEAKLYLSLGVSKKFISLAEKFGIEYNVLINEASIALLTGIERLDVDKNNFSLDAFLKKIIFNHLSVYIQKNSRVISIKNTWRKVVNLVKARVYLTAKLRRQPSREEITDFLGIRETELVSLEKVLKEKKLSLDEPCSEENDATWQEMLPADIQNPEEELGCKFYKQQIMKALKKLSPKTQEQIIEYFGLLGQERNLSQIAKKIGQSRAGVSASVKKGLRKLKNNYHLQRIYQEIKKG